MEITPYKNMFGIIQILLGHKNIIMLHTLIQIFHPILQHPVYTLLILWGIFKYKDLKEVLSDETGRLSSRRVIAMLAANCLFHICEHCVYYDVEFDPRLGWTLAITSFMCLGLVAFADLPNLLDKLAQLKGGITKQVTNISKEVTQSSTEEVK